MYRWVHPLKFFVMGAVMVIMALLTVEFFVSVVSAIHVLNLGYENPNITLYHKDWARIIAASVWVCLFSLALLGCAVNLSNALRLGVSRVKKFSAMNDLSKDEAKILHEWLNLRTYDLEHLKELWGEDHE